MTTAYIGKPIDRVDGRAKVTGTAKYAAEHRIAGLVHGHVISSDVAKGRVVRIDTQDATRLPRVLTVLTHDNTPRLASADEAYRDEVAPPGSPFRPLQDARVRYSTQPIGLVVAETFELARHAASLVRVAYERDAHETSLAEARPAAYRPGDEGASPPDSRGDAELALTAAAVRIDAEYWIPAEHHNPMECFAATVVPGAEGRLTIYDKTQSVGNVQDYLCRVFGYERDQLRVVSPFVGGAFGSGLRPQYHVFLAVLAARQLGRAVRVSLTRQQMWSFGHRPATHQRVALGASADGTLQAIIHEATAATSRFEDYAESVTDWSGLLYRCDNVRLDHKLVKLDLYTPMPMRAPGAASGVWALECAMDELAVKLDVDPVELRLANYAERDQNDALPFSSKELARCYRLGAERFGWARRPRRPRSMRDGHMLTGWGMASGVWEASQQAASARAVLTADGNLAVSSATADIGPGTYTIMTQIAAETLAVPIEDVTFTLGDTSLPESPVEGGSWTAASVGSAVALVCGRMRQRLVALAREISDSPLAGIDPNELTVAEGHVRHRGDASRALALGEVLRRGGLAALEEQASTEPSPRHEEYSRYAHSAVFVEAQVDEDLGMVRVSRVVSAVAGGRILNPKTARSQVIGGIVWGIGMALHEESVLDHGLGRFMTRNLADYHIPVNPDLGEVDVTFVEEHDDIVNPLGAKGLGEIGGVGTAAAVANAVFHATGTRVRHLPITPDKLID